MALFNSLEGQLSNPLANFRAKRKQAMLGNSRTSADEGLINGMSKLKEINSRNDRKFELERFIYQSMDDSKFHKAKGSVDSTTLLTNSAKMLAKHRNSGANDSLIERSSIFTVPRESMPSNEHDGQSLPILVDRHPITILGNDLSLSTSTQSA